MDKEKGEQPIPELTRTEKAPGGVTHYKGGPELIAAAASGDSELAHRIADAMLTDYENTRDHFPPRDSFLRVEIAHHSGQREDRDAARTALDDEEAEMQKSWRYMGKAHDYAHSTQRHNLALLYAEHGEADEAREVIGHLPDEKQAPMLAMVDRVVADTGQQAA